MSDNRLKLTGGNELSVLDFDGSTYVSSISGLADASKNKILTFNLWLDTSTHGSSERLVWIINDSAPSDHLTVILSDGRINLTTSNGTVPGETTYLKYNIDASLLNRVLNCKICKAERDLRYFMVDDVSLVNVVGGDMTASGSSTQFGTGLLDGATIWDIRLFHYDSSQFSGDGTLMNYWKGYPAGNTNAAWVDLAGSIDLSISSSRIGGAVTRNITGYSGFVGGENKLKLTGVENNSNEIKIGLLYNWYAATDASFIYADGWKIPTTTEFNTLRANGSNYATGFKETGTTYWTAPNTWATNAFQFNGRGAGWRYDVDGTYLGINENLILLTTADSGANTTTYFMDYDTSVFNFAAFPKKAGASIRLLKVSTSLSDGESGTYTGNDGKVYRTICIGSQEWLADNLAETKYRDNTSIPEVTNGAAWAALTTGALCSYSNDWAYAFSQTSSVFNKLMLDKQMVVSYEAEAIALFARMTTEPSDALKTIINTAIRDLKAYGIWDKLDALAVYAMHTEQAALLDWKDYVDHTNYNGMDFTQYTGFSYDTSMSTSVYIGSNFDPSTKGVNYTLNDAMVGFWHEDLGDSGNRALLGARLSGNYSTMMLVATNLYAAVNMADSTGNSLATNAFGMIIADRESSTTIKRVINGSVGSAITQNSTKLSQRPLWVRGAYSYTTYGFSMNMFRAFFIGAHLTQTEHTNFYNVINTYMTAVDAL